MVRSLLQLIAFNIAQVGFLYARLNKIERILFTGNFIRNKLVTQIFIKKAFNYFADTMNYDCKCLFSKNEGFFGALAALRNSVDPQRKLSREASGG